ncbi:MAG: NAD(P)H-dependent oxidoreductase subunit E [Anaerolineales bacterium]
MEPESVDLTLIEPLLERYSGQDRSQLLPALFEVQTALGRLPEQAVALVGKALHVPLAEIYGVIEFYTMLYPHPTAETMIRICTSPMCSMLGGEHALHAAADQLGVRPGGRTEDGRFMIEA